MIDYIIFLLTNYNFMAVVLAVITTFLLYMLIKHKSFLNTTTSNIKSHFDKFHIKTEVDKKEILERLITITEILQDIKETLRPDIEKILTGTKETIGMEELKSPEMLTEEKFLEEVSINKTTEELLEKGA